MTVSINGKTYEAGELIAYVNELEKENELLKADLEFSAKTSSKNKQTVKEYRKLVVEYSSEGADLQDRIKELEKENESLENVKNIYIGDLLKAKEIIKDQKELLDRVLSGAETLSDFAQNTLRKVEQFLSEVQE